MSEFVLRADEARWPRAYLGDGVYASYDGSQVWLRTHQGMEIALDDETFGALITYMARLQDVA